MQQKGTKVWRRGGGGEVARGYGNRVRYYCDDCKKDLFEGVKLRKDYGYSLSELAFRVRLGKNLSEYTTNPPYVKAAKMLQERGIEVKKGDIIEYVITKNGAKPWLFARQEEIDRVKYVEYLKSMVGQILDAFDMDFDEIIGIPKQEKLERFFLA